MSQTPGDRRYTTDHEWIKIDGDVALVGITDFAQSELGDVTYVEVPQVGRTIEQGETFGVVESVKAVSDIYSPVTGEVAEVNESLTTAPEKLNEDPHGSAWLVKIKLANAGELDGLMSRADYEAYIGGL